MLMPLIWLKQGDLLVFYQPGSLICFMNQVVFFQIANQKRRVIIMLSVVCQNLRFFRIGITIAAEVQTAAVGTDVVAHEAVTVGSGVIDAGNFNWLSDGFFHQCLRKTAGYIGSGKSEIRVFVTQMNGKPLPGSSCH